MDNKNNIHIERLTENLDDDIVKEINRRYEILKDYAKPNDIATGMSGSFVRFNMALCVHGPAVMSEWYEHDEKFQKELYDYNDCAAYDDYVEFLYVQLYNSVNDDSYPMTYRGGRATRV